MEPSIADSQLLNQVAPAVQTAAPASRGIGVLVVGDWFVDEHWVVGKHRAPSSSRTGREHSRALHRDTCSVRSLCGAGQVATILYQARFADGPPFQINGIGIWHPGDGAILKRMLDPSSNIRHTPHRLSYDELEKCPLPDESIKLYSLISPGLGVAAGTTRIIRIYLHRSDQTDLDQRIDWELPLSKSELSKIGRGVATTLSELRTSSTAIQHIFIKDLNKGVVSKDLILWLRKTFKTASWYVSSKEWHPNWFNDLPKNHVKLLLIPQLAAERAINVGKISSSSWLTAGGVPSQDAINVIDDLVIEEKFTAAKIIVLPEGMRVLARDGDNCYVLPSPGVADRLPLTPMASVFFPTLGAHMIAGNFDFFNALKRTVSFTAEWEKVEAQRLQPIMSENWVPTPDQVLSLAPTLEHETDSALWKPFNWNRLREEWNQAFSKFAVVTVHDGKRKQRDEFQLWRAMTDIRGYVTCIPVKRHCILTLLREGRSLKNSPTDDRRARSFFVVDQPGSGKSFMVDCLAATLAMPCLKFNIAALSKRDDLIDCFQRISATQSENRDLAPIIFFDEMNAKKEGQYIYDAFLDPLEDGTYVHNGKTFHLKPCLWIFAGTEAPVTERNADHASNKALDFESRLSHGIMYLSGSINKDNQERANEERDLERLRRLEQIYIGVATIRNVFPDVTKVSKGVLEAFSLIGSDKAGLPDSAKGPRGIKRFVRSFEYVQYGRVTGINLPDGWHTRMGIGDQLHERWKKDEEESKELLVEIRSRAED